MSRRASLFAKQNPEKARPKVRFPDELVFLDNIKENDIPALSGMLRRASLQVDISGINDAGNVFFISLWKPKPYTNEENIVHYEWPSKASNMYLASKHLVSSLCTCTVSISSHVYWNVGHFICLMKNKLRKVHLYLGKLENVHSFRLVRIHLKID